MQEIFISQSQRMAFFLIIKSQIKSVIIAENFNAFIPIQTIF